MYNTLIDNDFIDFIKKFENFCEFSYLDKAGVPTIGWGTTFYPDGSKVELGQTITCAKADKIILEYCQKEYSKLIALLPPNLNIKKPQLIALLSLLYNIGLTAFSKSMLLKFIRQDLLLEASDQFLRWIYVKKVVVRGLVNRRCAEREKFIQGLPLNYFPMLNR